VLASRWTHTFLTYETIDEFREPFLGGGSVAIHITKKYPNLEIWVNDLYEPLVNFWQVLQTFSGDLRDTLSREKSNNNNPEAAKELFLAAKDMINDTYAYIC
jgi:site-specific DNA-adenine methylase